MSEGNVYLEHGYQKSIVHKITGIVDTTAEFSFSLERPFNNWVLQVYGLDAMGDSQAASAWSVNLRGGYDSDKTGVILNHVNTSDDDGDLKAIEGMLAQHIEIEVASLTLGSAETIVVVVMGMKQ